MTEKWVVHVVDDIMASVEEHIGDYWKLGFRAICASRGWNAEHFVKVQSVEWLTGLRDYIRDHARKYPSARTGLASVTELEKCEEEGTATLAKVIEEVEAYAQHWAQRDMVWHWKLQWRLRPGRGKLFIESDYVATPACTIYCLGPVNKGARPGPQCGVPRKAISGPMP